jgi:hypothetical protein
MWSTSKWLGAVFRWIGICFAHFKVPHTPILDSLAARRYSCFDEGPLA